MQQIVKTPIKTVSINQSIEATQTEVSNIGSNKASDVSLSNVSGVKSTENKVLESKPDNAKALAENLSSNRSLDIARKMSHFITLRFEFNDNNSL